jgi:hypothetical protein
MEAQGVISMELTIGSKLLATTFFVVEVQGKLFLAAIGFMSIAAFLLLCMNS